MKKLIATEKFSSKVSNWGMYIMGKELSSVFKEDLSI